MGIEKYIENVQVFINSFPNRKRNIAGVKLIYCPICILSGYFPRIQVITLQHRVKVIIEFKKKTTRTKKMKKI